MKATLAGATVSLAAMRAAVATVLGSTARDVRERHRRAWVVFPFDVRASVVDALAQAVGSLLVVEVEMALGGRGDGLSAARFVAPGRVDERDLTETATELLHEWTSDANGGFDEDEVAEELAWSLAGDADDAPSSDDAGTDEHAWARALAQHLVANGAIELSAKRLPLTELGEVLRDVDADAEVLGARLLEALLESKSVDEVFADEDVLAEAARTTRPAD